jgi:Tape measure protein
LAVVRELVTLLGYKVDEAGLKQYEAGFARVKEMTLGFAGAMGLAFSAEKIYEFVDGLIESGQEVVKLRAQITNLLRPMDDINVIMDRGFEIAQETRFEYTKVLDTFKELLNVSQETGASQEDLLASTENIYKALRIDRASAENIQSLWQTVNRIFAVGQARPMTIGRIERLSPTFYRMLQEYFERTTGTSDLRALAKEHKITTASIIQAMKSISPEMQKRFEEVPVTLGQGFAYAKNQMVLAMSEFIKITRISIILGTAIKGITDIFVNFFKMLSRELGGMRNVIEVLGIALAVALGPWLIGQLVLATEWTLRWAAASLAANWPWVLLAASIAAVALGIQDLVYWMQGKGSLIGSWVGPFADLKKNFEALNIFSGFRFLDDLIKGDWKKAGEDLKTFLGDLPAQILAVVAAVSLVTAGFMLWKTLEFTGLIAGLTNLIKWIKGVETASVEAKVATEAIGKATVTPGAKPGSVPSVTPGAKPPGAGIGVGGIVAGAVGYALLAWQTWQEAKRQEAEGTLLKDYDTSKQIPLMESISKGWSFLQGKAEEYNRNNPPPTEAPIGPRTTPPGAYPGAPEQPQGDIFGWFKSTFSYLLPGMGAAGKMMMSPEALAKPTTDNRNQSITVTVPQTNNITVTTDDQASIAQAIQSKLTDIGRQTADAITKQIITSAPRTEAATQ